MQKKKGISLIVLVITIIVMVILAATVIVSLNNNGVIGKAKNAVKITNIQQVQDAASLIWTDTFLDAEEGKVTDLEAEVLKRLNEALDVKDVYEHYDIEFGESGVKILTKGSNTVVFYLKQGEDKYEFKVTKGTDWKTFIKEQEPCGYLDDNSNWAVIAPQNSELAATYQEVTVFSKQNGEVGVFESVPENIPNSDIIGAIQMLAAGPIWVDGVGSLIEGPYIYPDDIIVNGYVYNVTR